MALSMDLENSIMRMVDPMRDPGLKEKSKVLGSYTINQESWRMKDTG